MNAPSLAAALAVALLSSSNAPSPQATSPAAPPTPVIGPGPLHKVRIDAADEAARALLRAVGSRLEIDYGAFVVATVDEADWGGRAALLASGLPLADELDRIPLNGFVLDGAHPEALLAELPASQVVGDPFASALDPDAGLYLVQFAGPPKDAWLDALRSIGARFRQYTPANAYVVRLVPERVVALEALRDSMPEIQYVGVYHPAWRMTPSVRAATVDRYGAPIPVTVQLVEDDGMRGTLDLLRLLAAEVDAVVPIGPYVNVQLDLDPVYFESLAADPFVFAIEERGVVARSDERQGQTVAGNVSGSGPTSPGYLSWLASMGFGSSQFGTFSVNVVDDATSLTGHPDLASGRVDFQLNPTSQTGTQGGHGFINAHIVAGLNSSTGSAFEDASGYNYGLGIAPWAHVGSTAIFGPGSLNPSSFESTAYASGARISTNSWGFQSGGAPIPDYDSWAQTYDFLARDARSSQAGNQEYLIVFAAGNDGPGSNTVSTPGTAKNMITVGGSENNRPTGTDGCGISNSGANNIQDIISFSSRGPVDAAGGDGRWKPEVVAPATHVQGGVPQSNYNGSSVCNQYWPSGQTLYGWSSGTSHSTPAVAGGAALVYQDFLNDGLGAPSPAMIKAVLAGSSEYMTGVGANDTLPSNSQGMGLMDLGRAFDAEPVMLVDQTQVLGSSGATHVVAGSVANTGQPFRVALVWTDAPGSTTGAPWVNDLDLTVSVGGTTYRGNVFSGASSVAGGSADFRNNTESVFLPAGTSGAFTVTVTGATIAGDGVPGNGDSTDQDFALWIYNATTTGGGPIAAFTGVPTSGLAPLVVSFTDQSFGNVTSWSWDFGDGNTSTLQNPSNTYTSAGTYTVTLTVDGPDGPASEVKTNYISVTTPPPPGISDGSFESQTANTAPVTPWSIVFGAGHVVSPSGVSSDNGMPTHGTQWCEIAADSTNDATPPSNPGGVTNPAIGGAGISQSFTYPAGQTVLEFDAAFLRNEDPNSQYNDWMSVDVSDGTTTYNLYYKDTTSATAGSSSKYGYAMTPVEAVSADLAALFPSSTTSTQFTLTALVGNGTDNIQPSKGYVDDFLLTSPTGTPVAEFSGTPTSGTAPLSVTFTDLSTGGVTSWLWDFGDTTTSTAQNPVHVYASAGTYTVTLIVSGPGGGDSETKVGYVTVTDPPPVAEFSGTPTSGDAPLSVSFTDLSTGPVTSWLWDFGDTTTSTAQNPVHVYASAGTYTVTLIVSGPGGGDSETKVGYVTVTDPAPVAEFSGTPTSGTYPLAVSFTDLSTGPVTSWSWDFGDGNTSTLQNPSNTYTAAGTYTVTLTATGPGGSDGETKVAYVTVTDPAPVAEFSGTPTSGTYPLAVSFTDLSTGPVTSWSWDFGDGNTSTLQNPSNIYTSAGTYTVTLTATGPGGSDGETKVAYVTVTDPAPVAEFSGTPTSGTYPLAVSFTDLSTGPVTSWSWDFGDGNTSTLQNPSNTYTAAGSYTVTLTATGPGGSDGETKVAYVTVTDPAPVAEFSGTPTSGTYPLAVSFTDLSTGPVTSWSWDFGDGNTSTLQNPSNTYTAAGSYTVTLTATGPGGSDGETKVAYVTVTDPAPVAEFSGTPTSGTYPLAVSFTDLSTGPVTSWSWDFGDGNTSTLQNPSNTYTAAGTYTVTLTATGPGGADGETKTGYVTVAPFEIYCTAKVNSQGCVPQITASGTPGVSDPNPFDIGATMVLNQRNGLLFYGLSGRATIPFFGGTLCVQPALRRLPIQNAGGTLPPTNDCSGSYAFDFNAHIQSGIDVLLVPGQQVNAQYWSRDPNHPDGTGVGLTDAVEFTVGS